MINIPELVARGQQFGLTRSDQVLETFSGRDISIINRQAFWSFNIPIVPRSSEEAKEWRAALAQLASVTNTFKASPPAFTQTAYSANGGNLISVNGANQLGRNLSYKYASPSAHVFKVGEYFEVNNELKICVANSFASSGGIGSVTFEPALRYSPADDQSIIINQPKATFRLAVPVGGWSVSPNKIHTFNIQAVESYT